VADRRLTGILLAGGESARFGSPKALARLGDETLAERAWRLLGEVCEERLLVGPGGIDDPHTGPVAAIAAGLREASHEIAVVIPVDMPRLTGEALLALADACRDAAVAQAGPLPCAIRRAAFPETDERRLRAVLDGLDTARITLDERVLANVNTPAELERLSSTSA
jgi:molybdopterin-guanine dinucleotide biosynthesis protein A